ncbi:MAG: ATP-binding protein [Myxococcota bacterium]
MNEGRREVLRTVDRLSSIAGDFATVTDLRSLAAQVERALESLVAVEYYGLYLWDFEQNRLRLLVARGFTEEERVWAEASAWDRHPGSVFRSRQDLHVPDTEADGQTESSPRSFAVRSRLFMAVASGDTSLGVFGLASARPHAFTDEHVTILRFVCRLTGAVYGQFIERTARQRAQTDLASTARRLGMILGTLPVGVVAVDRDGRIALAQGAVIHALVPQGSIEGRSVSEVFAPVMVEAVEAVADGGLAVRTHASLDRMYEVRAQGHPEGVTLMIHDMTAHHRTLHELERVRDDALSATRAKSTFLATMSHELRTPLNAIIGYAELAMEENPSSPATAELGTIVRSAHQLLQLIDDILDLSKIEAGAVSLHLELVQVRDVVASAVALVRPQQSRNRNTMVTAIDDDVGAIVTDVQSLRRILVNLLGNANKFTRDGDVRLVAARASDAVVLSVHDTGIGMTEAEVGRVFDAFTQADSSTSRRYGGTGLGLTITRHLARLLGGEVDVTSRPGAGSTFRVRLPLAGTAEGGP